MYTKFGKIVKKLTNVQTFFGERRRRKTSRWSCGKRTIRILALPDDKILFDGIRQNLGVCATNFGAIPPHIFFGGPVKFWWGRVSNFGGGPICQNLVVNFVKIWWSIFDIFWQDQNFGVDLLNFWWGLPNFWWGLSNF